MTDALAGVRVLDAATLFAGPLAATLLADFGAEVVKIEHPKGDPVRSHGAQRDGVGLWWKMLGRGKKAVTLYLGSPRGRRSSAASSPTPTCWSRTSVPARWSAGASARTS
nr:CoA transferase [Actinomadura sp. J1-007]